MENTIVEIRAGAGGDDAKLLVSDQLSIYLKYAKRLRFLPEILDQRPG